MRITRTTIVLLLVPNVLSAAGGCSLGSGPTPRVVSLAEFAAPEAVQPPVVLASPEASMTVESEEIIRPAGDGVEVEQISATEVKAVNAKGQEVVEVAVQESTEEILPGQVFLLDSLVGQINGRPVYADAFFEPIEDELIAASERSTTSRQYAQEAIAIVTERLRQVVLDELFLAEAESNLTTEQQQGIRYWLRELREGIVSSVGGGTAAKAESRLQERESMSVDEYVDSIRAQALTSQLWNQKIESRVVVSWRDIEREYERRYEEFNPPATASLSRIRLKTERQAEEIEQVKTQLAAGVDFAVVAESAGMADGGKWFDIEMGENGLGESDLSEDFKARITDLRVGETSESFAVGTSTWWVHVTEINEAEQHDIYDPKVQRLLMEELRRRRQEEEQARYVGTLMEGGIYDEINAMAERLLRIAIFRYGP